MTAAIIDDHKLLLSGLKDIVVDMENITSVDTYASAEKFQEQHATNKYDIIITDIDMPGLSGSELVATIREVDKEQKILVLSMHKDHVMINNLFNMKVNGFLGKNSSPNEMQTAISEILEKGSYITKEIEDILSPKTDKKEHNLTKREIQIIQLISRGESNKTIANQCFISETTVKTHRKNIMLKLDLRNTAELVRFAIENKIS